MTYSIKINKGHLSKKRLIRKIASKINKKGMHICLTEHLNFLQCVS